LLKEDINMNTFDFSPLFRSTVGFDRLSRMLETGMLNEQESAYPPYNIVKVSDDQYRITMAVAGFSQDEIDITSKENQLIVQGRAQERDDAKGVTYLHRGIAARAFERRFQLADHIKVDGAALENGLLTISLVREIPEEMKPRKIQILSGDSSKLIEQKPGKKAAG
jgi:molecular chaperone IbpA